MKTEKLAFKVKFELWFPGSQGGYIKTAYVAAHGLFEAVDLVEKSFNSEHEMANIIQVKRIHDGVVIS